MCEPRSVQEGGILHLVTVAAIVPHLGNLFNIDHLFIGPFKCFVCSFLCSPTNPSHKH
jgi:hypothetical protein